MLVVYETGGDWVSVYVNIPMLFILMFIRHIIWSFIHKHNNTTDVILTMFRLHIWSHNRVYNSIYYFLECFVLIYSFYNHITNPTICPVLPEAYIYFQYVPWLPISTIEVALRSTHFKLGTGIISCLDTSRVELHLYLISYIFVLKISKGPSERQMCI